MGIMTVGVERCKLISQFYDPCTGSPSISLGLSCGFTRERLHAFEMEVCSAQSVRSRARVLKTYLTCMHVYAVEAFTILSVHEYSCVRAINLPVVWFFCVALSISLTLHAHDSIACMNFYHYHSRNTCVEAVKQTVASR